MSEHFFGRIVMLAVIGLTACSVSQQSGQLPLAAASAGSSHGTNRHVQELRAFAANCLLSVPILGIGICTNIELVGPAYGPNTPAQYVPGLHPSDLQTAYALPSAVGGQGQTIGVVIADADPNAQADVAVYRSTFGLPACTSANGCFQVIAAGNNAGDQNWAREASTDLQMASAVCPNCHLLLYEAKSDGAADLAAAVSAAVAAGATVVSNSYIIPEGSGESDALWSNPGVPIVAASGDLGYGSAFWPAAATDVIAVGATTLFADSWTSRGWSETTWSSTGSACSTLAAKPAWQHDPACSKRTVADVAAVGDPQTPVAVYDSYKDNGWIEVGGTSVSTPIVAGVFGLAANGTQLTGAASLYANPRALFPITSGSNGICLFAAYLCDAGSGYNGPAGMGSPNGIAAF